MPVAAIVFQGGLPAPCSTNSAIGPRSGWRRIRSLLLKRSLAAACLRSLRRGRRRPLPSRQIWPAAVTVPKREPVPEQSVLKIIADYWHILGAPLGMMFFLGTGLLAGPEIRGRIFVTFAGCLVTAALSAQILKRLVGRIRPQWAHSPRDFSGPWAVLDPSLRSIADSMPSGHTAVAFAMGVALSWRWPRFRALWIFLAIGVAISRVVLGHHFPSDVILASWLGTTAAMVALHRLVRFWTRSSAPEVVGTSASDR